MLFKATMAHCSTHSMSKGIMHLFPSQQNDVLKPDMRPTPTSRQFRGRDYTCLLLSLRSGGARLEHSEWRWHCLRVWRRRHTPTTLFCVPACHLSYCVGIKCGLCAFVEKANLCPFAKLKGKNSHIFFFFFLCSCFVVTQNTPSASTSLYTQSTIH